MIYPFIECKDCKYMMKVGPCPAMIDRTIYDARVMQCPYLTYSQDSARSEESYYIEPNE